MRIFRVQLEQIMSFMQKLGCEGSSKVFIFWGVLGYCFYYNFKLLIYHKSQMEIAANCIVLTEILPLFLDYLQIYARLLFISKFWKFIIIIFQFFHWFLCRENLVGFFLTISLLNTSIFIDSSIQNYSYQLIRGSKISNLYAEVWNTINLILMIK